ncbi:GspH/FimT family pseudopilin [bacterium]|nr:GspH/FimT family pseudopilin [bacterium]MCI0605025.1 GspH/FimT family pseudopilin [bacterium]
MNYTRFRFAHSTLLERGFSLLEALLIIGLIAIIAAVSLPAFYNTFQKYRVQSAARQVEMNLRFARLAAVKKKTMHQVLFRNTSGSPPNTYVMMMDSDKNGAFDEDIEIVKNIDTSLPEGLTILSGGINSVTYNARGAATLAGGTTVRIRGTEDTYRIDVRTNGAVSSQVE